VIEDLCLETHVVRRDVSVIVAGGKGRHTRGKFRTGR
jgi:hypothetical protein